MELSSNFKSTLRYKRFLVGNKYKINFSKINFKRLCNKLQYKIMMQNYSIWHRVIYNISWKYFYFMLVWELYFCSNNNASGFLYQFLLEWDREVSLSSCIHTWASQYLENSYRIRVYYEWILRAIWRWNCASVWAVIISRFIIILSKHSSLFNATKNI